MSELEENALFDFYKKKSTLIRLSGLQEAFIPDYFW